MFRNRANPARKNQSTGDRKMSAAAALDDRTTFNARLATTLRSVYGNRPDPHKAMARDAQSTPRATKNWWDGENCPGLWHFIQMARREPALKAEVARLLDLEADLDPMLEQHMSALVQAYIERKGSGA